MEMEKAVAFTILPGSWDQTKRYNLLKKLPNNLQGAIPPETSANIVQIWSVSTRYTQFSLFSGEIAIKQIIYNLYYIFDSVTSLLYFMILMHFTQTWDKNTHLRNKLPIF